MTFSNKFIFDSETGGLDEKKTSLLTFYGLILDKNLEPIDEIELAVKPDDGLYHVTAEALEINKIDLIAHSKKAIPYSKAANKLKNFLSKHSSFGGRKLIPCGHNINLDLRFIKEHLIPDFNYYCSTRVSDTSSHGRLLQDLGVIPEENECSLISLCEFFGIPVVSRHDAKGDVLMTLQLLKAISKKLEIINQIQL